MTKKPAARPSTGRKQIFEREKPELVLDRDPPGAVFRQVEHDCHSAERIRIFVDSFVQLVKLFQQFDVKVSRCLDDPEALGYVVVYDERYKFRIGAVVKPVERQLDISRRAEEPDLMRGVSVRH